MDMTICAIAFVVVIVIYLYPRSPKTRPIPGADPTSKESGNLPDINKAGSLHQFLLALHRRYGPISSFWFGQQLVVSIASAALFKEDKNVFDKPPELFKVFEPLLGTKCILYANKIEGRTRRDNYDPVLSHSAMKRYYGIFQSVANNLMSKWESFAKDEHISLSRYTSTYSLQVTMLALMGGDTFYNDNEVLDFLKYYDIAWNEIERQLTDIPAADSRRMKTFNNAKEKLSQIAKRTVEHRRKHPPARGEELLIDVLMEHSPDDETLISDIFTYIMLGLGKTKNLLTWCVFHVATNPDVQDKVVQEVKDVLGSEDINHTNISNLIYVRQVIDETLRCAVLTPWTARFQQFESSLGGYIIPKDIPVIHALGVVLQDETVWPQPKRFDPDRFNADNFEKRHPFGFMPFGFAGKRMCPGYRFAYTEATVFLVTLLRQFKVSIVKDQKVSPVYGLITHPNEEIWINIQKRFINLLCLSS